MVRRAIVKAARAHVKACRRATLDDPPASGPVYMMAEDSDVLPLLGLDVCSELGAQFVLPFRVSSKLYPRFASFGGSLNSRTFGSGATVLFA